MQDESQAQTVAVFGTTSTSASVRSTENANSHIVLPMAARKGQKHGAQAGLPTCGAEKSGP